MIDFIAEDPDTLRYWYAKQMMDPERRIAELEALILDWTMVRRGWPLTEHYLYACEQLETEGMRLWKLAQLGPVVE